MKDNFPLWVEIVFSLIVSEGMHLWFLKVGWARPYEWIACSLMLMEFNVKTSSFPLTSRSVWSKKWIKISPSRLWTNKKLHSTNAYIHQSPHSHVHCLMYIWKAKFKSDCLKFLYFLRLKTWCLIKTFWRIYL